MDSSSSATARGFFRKGFHKMVLKVGMRGDKDKRHAMKIVSKFTGVDEISVNLTETQMTVAWTNQINEVAIVMKLRKHFHTEIISLGPAEEAQCNNEEQGQNEEDATMTEMFKNYQAQNLYSYYSTPPPCYYYYPAQESPSACVII